jgi:hypothetical protein
MAKGKHSEAEIIGALKQLEAGQIFMGNIAQDVPSPNGSNIRAGSKVEGRIFEVTSAGSASGPRISIQFEKVYSQGKAIPVTTNLRAMAGFMEVMQTGVPQEGASERTPSNWWTATQVGGDSGYGVGGRVMSAEDSSVMNRMVPAPSRPKASAALPTSHKSVWTAPGKTQAALESLLSRRAESCWRAGGATATI